ncbi:uncharacterized protein [Macrobrachium rosenbergii]|uniref:uncharacterized protein n=1 Tax=Macrobrachium rosenbergii TaxID=79674 RepID=UPI0034D56DC3
MPLSQSWGARHLLIIIDCSTHWPEATPMDEASTTSCAEALLSSWISHFGVPNSITTDRGLCLPVRALGLLGMPVEQLPWVLLGLCTALKANGDASPAEKVYGKTLAVPGEFFPPSADSADTPLLRLRELAPQRFTPCHKTFTDRTVTYSPLALHSCACVFFRVDARLLPLTRPYRGPHQVIRRASKAFLLDIHEREDWITIDRLKPTFLLDSEICEVGSDPKEPMVDVRPKMMTHAPTNPSPPPSFLLFLSSQTSNPPR